MIKDLECTKCGHIEERFYQSTQPNCTKCGGLTTALITADWSFTFSNGKGTDGGNTIRFPTSLKNKIKRG